MRRRFSRVEKPNIAFLYFLFLLLLFPFCTLQCFDHLFDDHGMSLLFFQFLQTKYIYCLRALKKEIKVTSRRGGVVDLKRVPKNHIDTNKKFNIHYLSWLFLPFFLSSFTFRTEHHYTTTAQHGRVTRTAHEPGIAGETGASHSHN